LLKTGEERIGTWSSETKDKSDSQVQLFTSLEQHTPPFWTNAVSNEVHILNRFSGKRINALHIRIVTSSRFISLGSCNTCFCCFQCNPSIVFDS